MLPQIQEYNIAWPVEWPCSVLPTADTEICFDPYGGAEPRLSEPGENYPKWYFTADENVCTQVRFNSHSTIVTYAYTLQHNVLGYVTCKMAVLIAEFIGLSFERPHLMTGLNLIPSRNPRIYIENH